MSMAMATPQIMRPVWWLGAQPRPALWTGTRKEEGYRGSVGASLPRPVMTVVHTRVVLTDAVHPHLAAGRAGPEGRGNR